MTPFKKSHWFSLWNRKLFLFLVNNKKNNNYQLKKKVFPSYLIKHCSKTKEIVANKIDKFNNNLTPPPSPSVKRSSHLWLMGVLKRKDSTAAASNVALSNALNNNRISCPTGNANRSPNISILRHHRYYYSEVSTT